MLAATLMVFDQCDQSLVGAYAGGSEPVKVLTFGALVLVNHHLLGTALSLFTQMYAKFLTLRNPGKIVIAVAQYGDRLVIFLYPVNHFLVEGVSERLLRSQHGVFVLIFRVQVRKDIFIGASVVAQPVVGVGT